MTTLANHLTPSTTEPPVDAPPRLRRTVGALCAPAMLLALLATGLFDHLDDQAKPATQLRQLAGHTGDLRPLGWLELLAGVFAVGMVLSFVGLTRQRGRGLGNAGAVVGALGVVGMAAIGVHHWALGAAATLPRAQGAQVIDRLDTIAGPGIVLTFLATPVAMVLFALAGHRAGFVPAPALGLVALFFVGELVPGLPGGELVPLVLALLGFGWTTLVLLREP